MEKNAVLRHSTIAALAIILMLSATCTPTFASSTKPKSSNSFWFICYAGYAVMNIPVIDYSTGLPVGLLGIDAYHVIASSFGNNYDLVMYYLVVSIEPMVVTPLAFYVSNPNMGGLGFQYNPSISVSRDPVLTIIVDGLPSNPLPTPYAAYPYVPSTLTFKANPWQNRPEMFQEQMKAGPLDVKFTGIWCGPSAAIIDPSTTPPLVAQEFYVFLVKVVLTVSSP